MMFIIQSLIILEFRAPFPLFCGPLGVVRNALKAVLGAIQQKLRPIKSRCLPLPILTGTVTKDFFALPLSQYDLERKML